MTPNKDPLQLSLGSLGFKSQAKPHNNRALFSDHCLENLLPADPRWEAARPEEEAFLAWLQDRYLAEKNQLPKYNESQLEGSSQPAEC